MMNRIETGKLICRLISCSPQNKGFIRKRIDCLSDSDWKLTYEFAQNINLLPIIFYKLKKLHMIDSVPKEIKSKMQVAYIGASGKSLKLQYQLKEILGTLNKEKIDIIILKGAYVTNKYYEHPGLRPMCDIDVLARKSDIQRTYKCLVNKGYTPARKFEAEVIDLYRKHIPPLFSQNKYPIEIHKELIQPRKKYLGIIDINDIWNNASSTSFLGHTIMAMCPEHLILHLAYAISEDGFKNKILHLYDIYMIITQEQIDWNFILGQSKRWKMEKVLLCTFLQLKEYFSLEYSYPIIEKLESMLNTPTNIDQLAKQLKTITFGETTSTNANKTRINRYCSNYGFYDTFKFTIKVLFSNRWYMYKFGLDQKPGLFSKYRLLTIKEVLNDYFKPFVKYVLFGSRGPEIGSQRSGARGRGPEVRRQRPGVGSDWKSAVREKALRTENQRPEEREKKPGVKMVRDNIEKEKNSKEFFKWLKHKL